MILERVEVSGFRNLTSISLSPAAGLNVLEGKNGGGKTSFLEAIHMLAMARSFRTAKSAKVIQYGQDHLLLFTQFDDGKGKTHRLGLQRFNDNRMLIKLDGQALQSRSELVQLLPIQIITPESIALITGSPGERRQYLDWVMFHVEPSFQTTWSHYQRYLRQRNVLLRERRIQELPSWNSGLVEHGERLNEFRNNTINQLQPHIERYIGELLPGISISTTYRQGWRSGLSFEEALNASRDADLSQKYTTVGPHRAELMLCCGEIRVVDSLSRGQLKLLLCALKLAQLDYLKEVTGKTAVVLIDDLPAELDSQHRKQLLSLLHDLNNQVFVTTTDRSHLNHSNWEDVKMFHVEHGEIKEVV